MQFPLPSFYRPQLLQVRVRAAEQLTRPINLRAGRWAELCQNFNNNLSIFLYRIPVPHFVFIQMAFTLYSLLEAGLLVVNAIAILNEERFLKKSE